MFQQEIITTMKKVIKAQDVAVVNRLLGGMSNYTYVVEADKKLYTFRILGDYAEKFVDRSLEKENIKLFEGLKVTNETIYLNVETGVKIGKYIEGISLNQVEDYPYEKIVEKLKIIHNSSLRSKKDYQPFKRLDKYEQYLKDVNFSHPEKYYHLKTKLLSFKPYLESQPQVLCHGDSQPSNFVLTTAGEIVVVDFEFSGNNDVLYDIACFGNISFSSAKKLLSYYYGDDLDNDKLKRLYLWRIFQCFQWFNVAEFKELYGLSEKLKIDFDKVAKNYLNTIETLFNEMKKLQI